MDRRKLLSLWRNEALAKQIRDHARRYFSEAADQEDAIGETWAKLAGCKDCPPDLPGFVRRFVRAYYMRRYRLRQHEAPNVNMRVNTPPGSRE